MVFYLWISPINASSIIKTRVDVGCIERDLHIGNIDYGEYKVYPVGDVEVVIYRRTKSELQEAKEHSGSIYDDNYPGWWPVKKYPITNELDRRARSVDIEYFVFWRQGPVYGYFVHYLPNMSLIDFESSEDFQYLGRHWKGGFVDMPNQIGYDSTGRPVAINVPLSKIDNAGNLPKLNLLVPLYEYSKESKIVYLKCVE